MKFTFLVVFIVNVQLFSTENQKTLCRVKFEASGSKKNPCLVYHNHAYLNQYSYHFIRTIKYDNRSNLFHRTLHCVYHSS